MKILQIEGIVPHLVTGVTLKLRLTDLEFQHEYGGADQCNDVNPLA